MKNNLQMIVLMSLIHTTSPGQSNDWNTGTTHGGAIVVKSRIYYTAESNTKKEQVVEYTATVKTQLNMRSLRAIFNNASVHKDFMGSKSSVKIKTVSDDENIVYHFYKGVWPYPSSDLVVRMLYEEDAMKKVIRYTLVAEPSLLENKGIRRLTHFNATYSFAELRDGTVEITLTSKFTPAVQLPVFIANTWFPEGPAGYLDGIVKLANAH